MNVNGVYGSPYSGGSIEEGSSSLPISAAVSAAEASPPELSTGEKQAQLVLRLGFLLQIGYYAHTTGAPISADTRALINAEYAAIEALVDTVEMPAELSWAPGLFNMLKNARSWGSDAVFDPSLFSTSTLLWSPDAGGNSVFGQAIDFAIGKIPELFEGLQSSETKGYLFLFLLSARGSSMLTSQQKASIDLLFSGQSAGSGFDFSSRLALFLTAFLYKMEGSTNVVSQMLSSSVFDPVGLGIWQGTATASPGLASFSQAFRNPLVGYRKWAPRNGLPIDFYLGEYAKDLNYNLAEMFGSGPYRLSEAVILENQRLKSLPTSIELPPSEEPPPLTIPPSSAVVQKEFQALSRIGYLLMIGAYPTYGQDAGMQNWYTQEAERLIGVLSDTTLPDQALVQAIKQALEESLSAKKLTLSSELLDQIAACLQERSSYFYAGGETQASTELTKDFLSFLLWAAYPASGASSETASWARDILGHKEMELDSLYSWAQLFLPAVFYSQGVSSDVSMWINSLWFQGYTAAGGNLILSNVLDASKADPSLASAVRISSYVGLWLTNSYPNGWYSILSLSASEQAAMAGEKLQGLLTEALLSHSESTDYISYSELQA